MSRSQRVSTFLFIIQRIVFSGSLGGVLWSTQSFAMDDVGDAINRVSVLSYNVLFDAVENDKTLDAIERANADIVCIRELSSEFSKAFERRFRSTYPYRQMHPKKSGTWGVGVASRWKLTHSQMLEQKPHRMPALEVRVETGQGALLLACLHLFPPLGKHRKSDGMIENINKNRDLRRKQAQHLVERYVNVHEPILLVGDMNEDADGDAVQTFEKAGFQRSCRIQGQQCGATFPAATSVFPAVFEVDHILGRGVTFTSARVIREGGSDHFPVSAAFILP